MQNVNKCYVGKDVLNQIFVNIYKVLLLDKELSYY